MITVRKLIEANRIAFREGTLGAFKHTLCRYDYEDGCHCAIGAALTVEELARVHTLGLNGQPLGVLRRNGLEVERPEIFGLVQAIHDCWASGNTFLGEHQDYEEFPEIAALVEEYNARKIGPVEFVTMLDVLEHVFQPTVEVSSFRLGERVVVLG